MDFRSIADAKRFAEEKYQKVNLFESPLSMLDVYCLLPGQSQKLHNHKNNDKYYLIWEGRATVQIGTEIRELGPGEAALAKPGIDHSIANNSAEPLVALVFQAPKPF